MYIVVYRGITTDLISCQITVLSIKILQNFELGWLQRLMRSPNFGPIHRRKHPVLAALSSLLLKTVFDFFRGFQSRFKLYPVQGFKAVSSCRIMSYHNVMAVHISCRFITSPPLIFGLVHEHLRWHVLYQVSSATLPGFRSQVSIPLSKLLQVFFLLSKPF